MNFWKKLGAVLTSPTTLAILSTAAKIAVAVAVKNPNSLDRANKIIDIGDQAIGAFQQPATTVEQSATEAVANQVWRPTVSHWVMPPTVTEDVTKQTVASCALCGQPLRNG